jgi:hypothetical protein
MPIAYYLSVINRKRKYVEEKMTETLKFKQSSIEILLSAYEYVFPLIKFSDMKAVAREMVKFQFNVG